jgi:hypothetical protein
MVTADSHDREKFHQTVAEVAPGWTDFAAQATALVDIINAGRRIAGGAGDRARRALHVRIAKDALARLETDVQISGDQLSGARFEITDLERMRAQLDALDSRLGGVICGRA